MILCLLQEPIWVVKHHLMTFHSSKCCCKYKNSAQANTVYSDLEAETIVGSGTSAVFEISRDGLGDITSINVTNGGVNMK